MAQLVGGISLSKRKYTLDLSKDSGFLGYKPVDTPMDPNQNLMIVQGEPLEHPNMYRRLV